MKLNKLFENDDFENREYTSNRALTISHNNKLKSIEKEIKILTVRVSDLYQKFEKQYEQRTQQLIHLPNGMLDTDNYRAWLKSPEYQKYEQSNITKRLNQLNQLIYRF